MNEASFTNKDVIDAFKTLGITVGDYSGVDKAYKVAAKKNHPDLGGNAEAMKSINNAKDAIDNGPKVNSDGKLGRETAAEREARNKERVEKAQIITDYLYAEVNPLVEKSKDSFLSHFKSVFNKDFVANMRVRKTQSGDTSTAAGTYDYHKFNGHVEWLIEFTTSIDSTKFILDLEATVYEKDFETSISLENIDPTINYSTFAYSNGKKTKMKQRSWGLKKNASDLGKPDEFFPTPQLKKMQSTAILRKTKRADAFAFLKTELKATSPFTDKDVILIPINTEKFIQIRRSVWMSKASWSFDRTVTKKAIYTYTPEVRLLDVMRSDSGMSSSLTEEMPNFSEVMKLVIGFIIEGKYSEAGKTVEVANTDYLKLNKEESFNTNGDKMKSLAEQYLDVMKETGTDMGKLDIEKISNKPEETENESSEADAEAELPNKLSNLLDKLSKKPTAQKVEMQDALISHLIKTIQDLPTATKLLKEFIAAAQPIVLKGEIA